MFGLSRKDTPEPSGQQRRAAANRKADRIGRRQIDARPENASGSYRHPDNTGRRWWQS